MSDAVVRQIPLESIVCRKQVRPEIEQAALAGLAAAIREVGLQQPLSARREGDVIVLLDGHRRLAACRLAGMTSVPVIVEERTLGEADVIQRQLIANCQREALSALEKATAIDELTRLSGCTAAETAAKLGLSASAVTRSLALLSVPEPIQAAVAAKTVTASAAYELSQVADPALRAEWAEQLLRGTLTRDGLAGMKKAAKTAKAPDAARAKPGRRAVAWLDRQRSITFAGAGPTTVEQAIEWLEALLPKARKARSQGLSLSTFLKALKDQAFSLETSSCE